jgi:integrase
VALKALIEHRNAQEQMKIKAGDRWREQRLVFCNRFGEYFNSDVLLRIFHGLLNKAGLPDMRFHDLRHSAATILMAAGVHPKMVQERMGHSTIAMTMDIYSHVLPSMQQEVAEKIDDMFKRS